jgi:hypothetical protein
VRKSFGSLIVIKAVYFTHTILTRPVGTKYHVTLLNAFRDRPQCPAGQPRAYLSFVGMGAKINGDELLVKSAPLLRELGCQVLVNAEVGPDEIARKTLVSVDTFRP